MPTVRSLLAAAVIAFGPLGCVLSVSPVVSESHATFDERLVGAWDEVDGSDRAVIRRASGNSYAIDYTSDGKTTALSARLGRIGERTVLDVWPSTEADARSYLPGMLMIPAHLLVTVEVNNDDISVALLESDSVVAALESGALRLNHEALDDRLVLTNPSEELRSALRGYLSRPGVHEKATIFRRRR